VEGGTVELHKQDGAWVLALKGEHDLTTAPAVRRSLDEAFDSGSAVVIDLSGVEFMDSTVLAILVHGREEARRHDQHGFAVVAPAGSFARRLIDVAALDRSVAITAAREQEEGRA
jgi:anti-sigma B factor antagonist